MKLTDIAINRPVTIFMVLCLMVFAGIISVLGLPVDFLPELDFPYVTVWTKYEGVAPQEIETAITELIEQAVSTIENVKEIRSYSREGESRVYVEFNWGTDLDIARIDVREKVDLISGILPERSDEPIVSKRSWGHEGEVCRLSISSPVLGLDRLRKIAEDTIKPHLERIEGAATAEVMGGLKREILVSVDARKLKAYDLPLTTVSSTLYAENLNNPGGRIEGGKSEFLVRTLGKLNTVQQIESLVVAVRGDTPIYIKDVAEVRDTFKERRDYARYNGLPAVEIAVLKESGGNLVQIADDVRRAVKRLETMLPNVNIAVAYDESTFVKASIATVRENALYGVLFATVVLFLFFRSFASTMILAIAMPISVIVTFVLIRFAGMTLNVVSLGGLALGIGMLVDNSVVVLENSFRFLQLGRSPKEAASQGTSQVAIPITVSTLTTLAVFIPIIWIEGISKELFTDFSLTVAFSLASSLFIAFTAVPMMASLFLRNRVKKASVPAHHRTAFGWFQRAYQPLIRAAINHRWKVVVAAVALLSISVFGMLKWVTQEFFPSLNRDSILIDVELPVGYSLNQTDAIATELEKIAINDPAVASVLTEVAPRFFIIAITLKPVGEREDTPLVIDRLRGKMSYVPGAETDFFTMGPSSGGSPLTVRISGMEHSVLSSLADEAKQRIGSVRGAVDVSSSDEEGRPEIQVRVDRKRCADFGLDVRNVAEVVETAMEGMIVGAIDEDGEETDIRVRVNERDRQSIEDLRDIVLSNRSGVSFPLSEVATVEYGIGPVEVNRQNQKRTVTIGGNIAHDAKLSVIRDRVSKTLTGMEFPDGYFWEFGGEISDMAEAFQGLTKAFVIAIVLVYIILAAEFESFVHPFTIILTVPFSIVGVFFALLVTGNSLNVPAYIGVIMLAGIVVNNAIVMIDYILRLRREENLPKREAVIQGATVRLRPILITALTTMLGMLPMSLGWGEGSHFYRALAVTVIGGLFVATFLTLLVLPVFYLLFDDISEKLRDKLRRPVVT
jgi:HAE1 family hydrophobic/amphiphilic exporter-1